MATYYVRDRKTKKYVSENYYDSIQEARKVAVSYLKKKRNDMNTVVEITVPEVIGGHFRQTPKWEVFGTYDGKGFHHYRCEKLDPTSIMGGPVWALNEDGTLGRRE